MAKKIAVLMMLVAALSVGKKLFSPAAVAQTTDAAQPAIAKRIGTVKSISGNVVILEPTSGPAVTVNVQPNARILRLAAGEKDLKSATPIQVTDLQVGDTIRVRGAATPDGTSLAALEVIVITRAAVAAVSDQLRQDWQKRGMGGRVDSVNLATGDVVVSIPSLAAKKTMLVHTSRNTVVYRYAPDSAKPEDAKPSSLKDIQAGDQLRARGNRNADGSEITAEEIFAGVFPQFAATVKSVDASAGTLSVQDLSSKKTVEVKVTADSQLHKIPPEMAQGFAMRLKGAAAGGAAGPTAGAYGRKPSAAASSQSGPPPNGRAAGGDMNGGASGGMRAGGPPDFQRILSRLPSSSLADLDLHKGDAVIILATEGTPATGHTAITLLSGVEPILQAAPSAGQAMMLTPWSLGGAPGGEAAQ
jgi:hypothetical protein